MTIKEHFNYLLEEYDLKKLHKNIHIDFGGKFMNNIPKVEGVVTKDIKYMKFIEHNYEELYDILHDPHEIDNLVNNPNYKNQLKEMRKKYLKLNKKYAPPSQTISQQKY